MSLVNFIFHKFFDFMPHCVFKLVGLVQDSEMVKNHYSFIGHINAEYISHFNSSVRGLFIFIVMFALLLHDTLPAFTKLSRLLSYI